MLSRVVLLCLLLACAHPVFAQSSPPPPPRRVTAASRWRHFLKETRAPITPVAGAFIAGVSQATRSAPRYGVGAGPLAERFGASVTDIASENFFVDFAMASVFHEDTRYVRRGSAYGSVWKRAAYAITRAFVTRKDTGGATFNWANMTGSVLSYGASALYYPPASRTPQALEIRLVYGIAGGALENLYPEFWPGFRRMLQRHHLFPRKW